VRVAAAALGVLGLAGGVLAAGLLASVGVLGIELALSPGAGNSPSLELAAIGAIASAVGLRGVVGVWAGRPDRGGLQFLAAGGGFLLLALLLLYLEPLAWLASAGAVLGTGAVGLLFLLAATLAVVAEAPEAP